jgi:hypothetical protein
MGQAGFLGACLIALGIGAAAAPAAAASISVVNNQVLRFGKFAAGTGGTISINPAGSRSASGGVALISSGTSNAAQFTVSGDVNLAYSLMLPGNGSVALTNGSGQSMSVTNFTGNPTGTGQLSGVGKQYVTVGATLNVGPNQVPGSYSGTFDLIVDYN